MMFVALGIVLVWALFLCWIDLGQRPEPIAQEVHDEEICVLIAHRNEREKLPMCLEALNQSIGFTRPINVVLVDDDSTDDTADWINAHQDQYTRLNISSMHSSGSGKKAALHSGMARTRGSWLYLTDADCEVSPTSISSLISKAKSSQRQAVFGPVLYKVSNLFSRIVAYEHLNTQAVSKAFLRKQMPIAVNAGNMLIHDSLKESYAASLLTALASGDDMLFAERLGEQQWVEAFERSTIVYTDPPSSISEFVDQRIRWASKYQGYSSLANRFLPPLIFLWSSAFIFMLIAAFIQPTWLSAFFLLWMCKWLMESLFHARWFAHFGMRVWPWDTAVVSVLYPFYFVSIGIGSLILPSFSWKGRTIKA